MVIPDNPPPQTFLLAGNVAVTDTGGLSVDQDVESAAITVNLPAVAVSKTVVDIKRGTQTVSPPAAPGDRITYQITVRNAGQVDLDRLWVMDSLIGPLFVDQSMVLGPGDEHLPPGDVRGAGQQRGPIDEHGVRDRAGRSGSTVSASTAGRSMWRIPRWK